MPKSSSATQKKKRLAQLRDAQRRRRERLRQEKQHFVQIILSETTIQQLAQITERLGETMQQLIARLVEQALHAEDEKTDASIPKFAAETLAEPTQNELKPEIRPIVESQAPMTPEGTVESPKTVVESEIEQAEGNLSAETVAEERKEAPSRGQLDLFG